MGRPRLHVAPAGATAYTCPRCQQVRQPEDAYYKADGSRQGWCRRCTNEYAAERHKASYLPIRLVKRCGFCRVDFVTPHARKMFCSKACQLALRGAYEIHERIEAMPPRACEHCGNPISPTKQRARFCSEQCNSAAHQWWRKAAERTGMKRSEVRSITRAEIGERDGWTCGICGVPVERTLRYPDPMYGSVDHVLPVAHGGRHDVTNLQIAHLVCNVTKRDRIA